MRSLITTWQNTDGLGGICIYLLGCHSQSEVHFLWTQFFFTGADEASAADNASEIIPDIVLHNFILVFASQGVVGSGI